MNLHELSQFFYMPMQIEPFVFMMLYLMLFWKRHRISGVVFIHIVLVAALFAGAWNISDGFLLVDNVQQNEISEHIFHYNIAAISDILSPLIFLWIYQDWCIYQESKKIDISLYQD